MPNRIDLFCEGEEKITSLSIDQKDDYDKLVNILDSNGVARIEFGGYLKKYKNTKLKRKKNKRKSKKKRR